MRQNVDFTQTLDPTSTTLDSGGTNAAAIRPINNGDPGTAPTFQRPSENLRTRTEVIRDELENLKYLADADRALLVYSSSNELTWSGLPTGTLTGTGGGSIYFKPFLRTPTSTRAKVVFGAGLAGELTLRTKQTGSPILRAYSNANDVAVTLLFTDTTSHVATVAIIADGTSRHATITFDNDCTVNEVLAAVNASSWASTNNLEAVLTNGSPDGTGQFNSLLGGWSEPVRFFFAGAVDAEVHQIPYASLNGFFGVGGNALQEGDVLCVWYDKLVNGSGGGRRESLAESPENSATIDQSSLFIPRLNPEKVPNALPLCTVVNGDLVFINGYRMGAATTGSIGGYTGPGTWADATTLDSMDMSAAITAIVTALASTAGADKIGVVAADNDGATTLEKALANTRRLLRFPNLLINGHFKYWQRVAGNVPVMRAINISSANIPTGLASIYQADRWGLRYPLGYTGSGNVSFMGILGSGLNFSGSPVTAKITRAAGATTTSLVAMYQELDRSLVMNLGTDVISGAAPCDVYVSIWAGHDATFSGAANNGTPSSAFAYDLTGVGFGVSLLVSTDDEAPEKRPMGAELVGCMTTSGGEPAGVTAYRAGVAMTSLNMTRYTVKLSNVLFGSAAACLAILVKPSGTAGASDSLYIAGVHTCAVPAGAAMPPNGPMFRIAGDTEEMERALCDKYYERSDGHYLRPTTTDSANATSAIPLEYQRVILMAAGQFNCVHQLREEKARGANSAVVTDAASTTPGQVSFDTHDGCTSTVSLISRKAINIVGNYGAGSSGDQGMLKFNYVVDCEYP